MSFKMKSNNEKLRFLMLQHNINKKDIAKMLFVTNQRVNNWLWCPESSNYRNMPTGYLEFFRLILKTMGTK